MSEDRTIDENRWENIHGERMCPDFLKEAKAAYQTGGDPRLGRLLTKSQGEYTEEDYFSLPDTCRVELINGVIYNMAAPGYQHQGLSIGIAFALMSYIRRNKGSCKVYTAPQNVQIDRDDKTVLQPDIIVICKLDRLRNRSLWGEPDMVVEILSPSTGARDLTIKYQKYKDAGVREYWIVNPKSRQVIVHDFEQDAEPASYTFADQVPVRIFGGGLKVDFAEIYEEVEFLYEDSAADDDARF